MRTRAGVLIGRATELAELRRVILAAARPGTGAAVFITGEPGIGKTRLMAEATGIALDEKLVVLRGRGSSVGPAVPFRPIAEVLLAAARTVDADLVGGLGAYLPVLGRFVPEWAHESPWRGDVSVVVLGEAVLRLAALVGRGRGCVLALDDLHDADPETMAVVEYLAGNLASQPVAVLATMRVDSPSVSAAVQAMTQRGDASTLTLDRLGPADLPDFVASCLDTTAAGVPDELVARLFADSAGTPLMIEELLYSMVAAGDLVPGRNGWQLTGTPASPVPPTLVRVIGARADRLGTEGSALLSVAAVLGRRFPLTVVQRMCALDDHGLLGHVQAAVDAQLLQPDEAPGWYTFQHPLTADALRGRLGPDHLRRLSGQAADLVEESYPGLPDRWCHLAAQLRMQAGEAAASARLHLESARRAAAAGAAGSTIALLDQARAALGTPVPAAHREIQIEILQAMLDAVIDSAQFDRAAEVADELGTLLAEGSGAALADLHLRLANAAQGAGRWADGVRHIEAARVLIGGGGTEEQLATLDSIEAALTMAGPAPDRIDRSYRLARAAADRAESAGLPDIAARSWYLLGYFGRDRDLAESGAHFRRAFDIATQHSLVTWRNWALVGLGGNAWFADADPTALHDAYAEAVRTGAVRLALSTAGVLALDAVLRAEFARADQEIDASLADAVRLKLVDVAQYLRMVRVVLAAHRGRRAELSVAFDEFVAHGGAESVEVPLAHGLGRAFAALLDEDRAAALAEMAVVEKEEQLRQSPFHLAGGYGLGLLLDVLAGRAGERRWRRVAGTVAGQMRWNRVFVALAEAVLAGRAGEPGRVADAVGRAGEDGAPFPTAWHLGLRLLAEPAVDERWGDPREWLRRSEEHFHRAGIAPVAGACRRLLRQLGESIPQRRTGVERIPQRLRRLGVTAREFEVLEQLARGLGNKALAGVLHISPRTVEKHVASLLLKTGAPHRRALSDTARELLVP